MAKPRRGEIWLINLDPVVGHEQGRTRPGIVVSDDKLNDGPSGLVTVIPITSAPRQIPIHIHVQRGVGGLTKESWILCDQIRTISKRRLIKPYESVDGEVMKAIEENLRIVLSLS